MLIPQGVGPALHELPGTRLAQRYNLYDAMERRLGDIQRLIAPSHAAGVSAIGARVEQIAGQPVTQYTPPDEQPLERQLVPIEEVIRDDGYCRLARVLGWTYV